MSDALRVLRERIQREYDGISVQAEARTLDFDVKTLERLRQYVEELPDLRAQSLDALAAFGEPGTIDNQLRLESIGWVDRSLESLTDAERIGLVEQAIARLAEKRDPLLLASALKVAETLPDLRTAWRERLVPLAAWAEKVRGLTS